MGYDAPEPHHRSSFKILKVDTTNVVEFFYMFIFVYLFGNELLLLLLVVVSLMFSGLLSTMLHRVFFPNTWDSHGHVLFYSDFIDSTFLRICAVPRIADIWRLQMLRDPGIFLI